MDAILQIRGSEQESVRIELEKDTVVEDLFEPSIETQTYPRAHAKRLYSSLTTEAKVMTVRGLNKGWTLSLLGGLLW